MSRLLLQLLLVQAVLLTTTKTFSQDASGDGLVSPHPDLVVFYLYYKNKHSDKDESFRRAAEFELSQVKKSTMELESLAQLGANVPRHHFLIMGVKTRQDFIDAWNEVHRQAAQRNAKVLGGSVFTHATKNENESSGLSFADDSSRPDQRTVLSKDDISNLRRLQWVNSEPKESFGVSESGGYLNLYGCNTGVEGKRGWSPAQMFSQRQGIICIGMAGFSNFSTNPKSFAFANRNDREIYLLAFRRTRNSSLGNARPWGPVLPLITYVNGERKN